MVLHSWQPARPNMLPGTTVAQLKEGKSSSFCLVWDPSTRSHLCFLLWMQLKTHDWGGVGPYGESTTLGLLNTAQSCLLNTKVYAQRCMLLSFSENPEIVKKINKRFYKFLYTPYILQYRSECLLSKFLLNPEMFWWLIVPVLQFYISLLFS